MALLLRACAQKRLLTLCVTHVKHHENNIKKLAPILQFMRFSTNRDQKNKDLTEIYDGVLAKSIWRVKFFSLTTSVAALVLQPFLYSKAIETDSVSSIIGISAIFLISGITMPLLMNLVTKKYVLKIYYDSKENKYIYKTYTLFLRKKEIKFTPDDVVVPDVTGMFTACFIKKEPVFFDNRYFKDHSHYIKIMGYDKPIDFKLGNACSENVKIVLKDDERKETENVR